MLVSRPTSYLATSLSELNSSLNSHIRNHLSKSPLVSYQCPRVGFHSSGVRHSAYNKYFNFSKNFFNSNRQKCKQLLSVDRQYTNKFLKPVMRFVQFTRKGDDRIRLGVVSSDGLYLTNLNAISNFPSDLLTFIKLNISMAEVEAKVQNVDPECITDDITLLPPILNPEKIVCIGLNYVGHCLEQKKEPPKEPMFFSKFASTLVGPTDNVKRPAITNQLDWEVELAVIMGKEAKHVSEKDAMDYVFGYSVAQDISARDWQKLKNGGQFLIGKSMDTFCPLGPAVVHKSLVADPHNLEIRCYINDVEKQCGNTKELIFNIPDIISRLSQSITLKPGDVILTGTPAGVGMHRVPPEFLKDGDLIVSEIQHLGQLRNRVVAE